MSRAIELNETNLVYVVYTSDKLEDLSKSNPIKKMLFLLCRVRSTQLMLSILYFQLFAFLPEVTASLFQYSKRRVSVN